MRSGFKRSQQGYSLAEMLVVIAIIGVLSLISVAAFMNFKRSADFKASMRAFTTDIRNARASAIANSFDVRVELANVGTANSAKNPYYFYSSRDNGVTWTQLTLPGATKDPANPTAKPNMKEISNTAVWLESTTNLPDFSMNNPSAPATPVANGMPDLVFHPNGMCTIVGGANATIVLRTNWKKIAFDKYTITFSPAGQFTVVGSHT